MSLNTNLVDIARAIAVREHRNQWRKAPTGERRKPFITHPITVAEILADARCDEILIAAALLHDIIEDTELDAETLLKEIQNRRVVELVLAVTEINAGQGWEKRNRDYYKRMLTADEEVLTLSAADKAHNLEDMVYWVARGYAVDQLLSRGHAVQLAKYMRLNGVYEGQVTPLVYTRFRSALDAFRAFFP